MVCILPIFFVSASASLLVCSNVKMQGISQCLITVRLGFADDTFDQNAYPKADGTGPREILAITVTRETHSTHDDESGKCQCDLEGVEKVVVDITGDV